MCVFVGEKAEEKDKGGESEGGASVDERRVEREKKGGRERERKTEREREREREKERER